MQVKMLVNHDDSQDTFNILANRKPSKPWEEVFDLSTHCLYDAPDNLSPTEYAQLVVNYFNDTLKPGEMPRRLISADWTWDPTRC